MLQLAMVVVYIFQDRHDHGKGRNTLIPGAGKMSGADPSVDQRDEPDQYHQHGRHLTSRYDPHGGRKPERFVLQLLELDAPIIGSDGEHEHHRNQTNQSDPAQVPARQHYQYRWQQNHIPGFHFPIAGQSLL